MAWRRGTANESTPGAGDAFLTMIDELEAFCTKTLYAGTPAEGENTGDGTLDSLLVLTGAPDERWDVICTTGGGDGVAVFSVTGSVSGAQTDATSGTAYSITELEFTINAGGVDFVAGDRFILDVASETASAIRYNIGTGKVYGASATQDSAVEIWTLECTTGGGNGTAIFSVTGSVSGAKAAATCGEPYSIDEVSFTILADTDFTVGDFFTVEITDTGVAEYEMKRKQDTNDYLSSIEWKELAGESAMVSLTPNNQEVSAYISGELNTGNLSIVFDFFALSELQPSASTTTTSTQPLLGLHGVFNFVWWRRQSSYAPAMGLRINSENLSSANIWQPSSGILNNWIRIAMTHNRSTRANKFYVDGVLINSFTTPAAFATATNMKYKCPVANIFPSGDFFVLNAVKNIQVYNKELDSTDISTVQAGGLADDLVHHWLCDEGEGERYAVDSVGGASYNFDLGPTKRELILRGKGTNGTSEIYTGVQSYTDASTKWNWALQGFSGYVAGSSFSAQPGAIGTPPAILLDKDSFDYLIHTTPNRVFVYADIEGLKETMYLGWYTPYFTADQWGYPITAAGSGSSQTVSKDDRTNAGITDPHRAWFNLSNNLRILLNGSWVSVPTSDPLSTNSFSSSTHETSIDSKYPTFDFIPYSATSSIYAGPFEGIKVPVVANTLANGDVLLDTEKAQLVIGDTFRTGNGSMIALDLTGDA